MTDADRRGTLLDSYENAAVIVSGIDAGELGQPTPCPEYDVAGLIDHLVEAGHRAAALGRGQAPPPGDGSPHVELSDAPGQLRSAAEVAAQAWDDDSGLSLRHAMPWASSTPEPPGRHVPGRAGRARLGPGQGHRTDRQAGPFPRLAGTPGRAMIKLHNRTLLGKAAAGMT